MSHRVVLVIGAALTFSSVASAQKPEIANNDWVVTVGAGGLYSPDYEGSDDYVFRSLPYISVTFQDWLTLSAPEGLKAALINENGLKAGLLAGYRFDRNADDNDALAGWGDLDGAVELGGFAEYRTGPFRLEFDIRHDVTNTHGGTVAKLSGRYAARIAGATVSVGPQVTWADGSYTKTYFGITPVQVAAAVLPYSPFAANGGIKDYGIGATVILPLDDHWSVTGIVSVSQLTGDAADSPIVAIRGSEPQFAVGMFVGYRF